MSDLIIEALRSAISATYPTLPPGRRAMQTPREWQREQIQIVKTLREQLTMRESISDKKSAERAEIARLTDEYLAKGMRIARYGADHMKKEESRGGWKEQVAKGEGFNVSEKSPTWVKRVESKYGEPFDDVVRRLQKANKTNSEIARAIGMPRTTFCRLAKARGLLEATEQ